MTKEYAVKRLETILNHTSCANGYKYKIKVNNWENNEKSRIYFSIVETRVGSKHHAEKKYGYIDNHTGEYVPQQGDLTKNYTFSGNSFVEDENVEREEIEVNENLTADEIKTNIIKNVEKAMMAVEESEKDDEMINEVKKLHQVILENMKSTDSLQLKEDFGRFVPNGDVKHDYASITMFIKVAEQNGRKYRERRGE